MSKDGLPVKKPKRRELVLAEPISNKTPHDEIQISKQEEPFDLNRIERELAELDKQGGFLNQLFGSISDAKALEQLKTKKEKLELRRKLRQEIIEIEKQNLTVRKDLLDLKTALLEKEVMSHEEVQRLSLEIKLRDLNIQKLQKEIEEIDLQRKKKEREKELKDYDRKGSEEKYDIRDFRSLEEITNPEDDETGNDP